MKQMIKRFNGNVNVGSFNIVQKLANLGYWEFDHIRREASWSNQMFEIYGMKSDFSMTIEQFFEFVHPEDRQRVNEQFHLAIESKKESVSEYRIVRQGGEVRYVVENITFIRNAENEILLTIGMIQDVTDNKKIQHRLTLEEQLYKSIFENNPDAVFSLDAQGRFLSCNSVLEQVFGYTKEEIINDSFHKFVDAAALDKTIQYFEQTVKTLNPQNYDTTGITRTGQTVEFNVTNIPIIINKKLIGVYGIAKDITQQKMIEQSLTETELKYRSIVEQSIVGIFVAQKNNFVYSNDQLNKMFGYDSLIGMDIIQTIHPSDREAVVNQLTKLQEGHSLSNFCHRAIKQDGTIIHCEVHYNQVSNMGEQAIVGVVLDVTDRSKAEELNQYLAYHDYLTEMPNRRMFEDQLDKQLRVSEYFKQRLAIMLIDVDRFKYVNDTLGHPIGDELLKQIAFRLMSNLRDGQTVFRLGGDEFAIIIADVKQQNEIKDMAATIIRLINEQFLIEGYELNVTASIGISQSPGDGSSVEQLMKNANAALYHAKSRGSNQSQCYSASLNVQSFKLFSLSNDLRKAQERGELFLHYMPRVHSQTMEIVGVEALLRWNHPDWGLVAPSEFIPIAEETGLIVSIGEWVLREACIQHKRWQSLGLPSVTLSVNFSVQQLLQQNILHTIDQIIEETGISQDRLEIEITESSFISNENAVTELLLELKKRKIKVSLDDFGTGYSSLYLLKRLALDTIKIDRSFIEELMTDRRNKSIIECIIQLAGELGMQVVAEGVETKEQFNYLREQRCDEIQGYYFSRPVEPDSIVQLLSRRSCKEPALFMPSKEVLVNRRKSFRIDLKHCLLAEMTITMFKGSSVKLGSTEVFVRNIGPGGLRFMVGVKLPVNSDILLMFKTKILNQMYVLFGFIVWYNELGKDIYEYGVQFQLKEKQQDELVNTLNFLAIKQRDGMLPQTQVYVGDPILRIKELKKHN
ncbi:hypothetical protein BK120_32940 [Paenibacillus sp. FSL A5-0031]|uniref:sensor domain-containing protein n=1 Tax=Paenibacillus sp. FSL A5-0031 TaxID=1920420 RepID=UPI00096F90B2|nr:GGDEF domain-containing phosphodiesterase [Paenibacillus sp. FSL A5-0031]OME72516.1 hypothetical protein BK120_32940 [Paenibacillus sp. FSL A5-0031]